MENSKAKFPQQDPTRDAGINIASACFERRDSSAKCLNEIGNLPKGKIMYPPDFVLV